MVDNTATESHGHVPVMRHRIVELLNEKLTSMGDDAILIDATLGAGGHSELLLSTYPGLRIIGFDADAQALKNARERLAPFGDRFFGVHARFDSMAEAIQTGQGQIFDDARRLGISAGLFDLGVSSMQLDQPERGFAYKVDAPLDMRMDPSQGITAADILNTYPHGALARVLKTYGDERFAGRIATAILREREKAPFSSSARLVELLYDAIPAATRRTGGHPAKRTFQALRIEVNKELEALENVLPQVVDLLNVGGRVVFMSYQSHEDRLVKRFFTTLTTSTTPPGLPMDLPGTAPSFTQLIRGAESADKAEIEENPRAASVRVRAFERIAAKTSGENQ